MTYNGRYSDDSLEHSVSSDISLLRLKVARVHLPCAAYTMHALPAARLGNREVSAVLAHLVDAVGQSKEGQVLPSTWQRTA